MDVSSQLHTAAVLTPAHTGYDDRRAQAPVVHGGWCGEKYRLTGNQTLVVEPSVFQQVH
jgi:hypothetical protein